MGETKDVLIRTMEKHSKLLRYFMREIDSREKELGRQMDHEEKLDFLLFDLKRPLLCQARAMFNDHYLEDWDCLHCYEFGYPLCDIECSLPCGICVRYELCKKEGRRKK